MSSPEIKVEAVRELGAEVELAGDTFADAKARCDELTISSGRVLIHPFDDPLVMAGQGTIAMEIVGQGRDDLAAIFVPVGGGGLIAGIAGYVASGDAADFAHFLEGLGYHHQREQDNAAYELFLGGTAHRS